MKKAITIIVSVLFVLAITSLSFATEEKKAAPAPAPAEKKAAPAVEEKKAPEKAMHVTGEVTAVNAAAKTLTIKGEKGEVVLTTTDKTKFAKGKTLADVKVGDKLSAKYSEKDGKMMAWKVMTKAEIEEMEKEHKEKSKEKAKE